MVEKSENNAAMDDNENYLEVRRRELSQSLVAALSGLAQHAVAVCVYVCVSDLISTREEKKIFRENFDDLRFFLSAATIKSISTCFLQLSKMNFSPFTTSFANVNVNQFAKFTQNLATPSQVSVGENAELQCVFFALEIAFGGYYLLGIVQKLRPRALK